MSPLVISRQVSAIFKPASLPVQTSNRQGTVHTFVDLALLKLNQSVTFTDRIQPIQLPAQGETFADRIAYASGFGATFLDRRCPQMD